MTNKKYFFIGIGGIGMSSIAQYLYEKGNTILGYDASENRSVKILVNKGIDVINDLSLKSIPDYMKMEDVIVIYTPAIPDDNIFLKYYRSNGNNPIYKRSEILGEISKQSKCIAVAGTHGKTTTTAMIGHLLVCSGLSPTIITGGIMNNFGQNIYLTDSNYVVVEADESDGTVFKLNPKILIYLNVDKEHLDYYKS